MRLPSRHGWWVGFLLCVFVSSSPAANLIWTNGSGLFNSATNWNTFPTAPANSDGTAFTNLAAYTVTFTNGSRYVMNSNVVNAGTVTFDLTGAVWTLTNNATGANAGANAAFVIAKDLNTTATVYLTGGTLAVTNTAAAANLVVGGLGQGTLIITNGTVIANRTKLGSGTGGTGAGQLVISGAVYTNTSTFIIGATPGSTGNALIVSNSGSLAVASTFTVGDTGAGGNTFLLDTGARYFQSGSVTPLIGNDSSNNTATVQGGATWDNGARPLTLGAGNAQNNTFVINGGVFTNSGTWNIGLTGGSLNSVILSNAGTLATGSMNIGNSAQSAGNLYQVGGLGLASFATNGITTIGGAGGGNNLLVVTNATLLSGSGSGGNQIIIGDGSSNNTVSILAGGTWRQMSGTLIAGNNNATGNTLNVSGGVFSGLTINVGSGLAAGNRLNVTEAGKLFAGAVTIGTGGSGNNSYNLNSGATVSNGTLTIGGTSSGANALTLTNATLLSGLATIGSGSSNNTATVLAGGLWNLLGAEVIVGSGAAAGNLLTVNAGSITNFGTLTVGSGGSGNQVLITNGGLIANVRSAIGAGAGANSNTVLVSGPGSVWSNVQTAINRRQISVGLSGSHNTLIISAGAAVYTLGGSSTPINGLAIGDNFGANSNTMLVTDNNSLFTNSHPIFVGFQGAYNNLMISNQGRVATAAGATIGYSNNFNTALVTGPGSRWYVASGITVGDGTGATNNGAGNSLTLANGGALIVGSIASTIGAAASASNNSVLVTGAGSTWTNGSGSSGAILLGTSGSSNTIRVADGGIVSSASGTLGVQATAHTNAIIVTGVGSLWTNQGGYFLIGAAGAGNTFTVTNGGRFLNAGTLTIGLTGNGNGLLLTDGSTAWGGQVIIGEGGTANNNYAVVTGAGSIWTNVQSGSRIYQIGGSGSANSLTVSQGGKTFFQGCPVHVGNAAIATSNTLTVTDNNSLFVTDNALVLGSSGTYNNLILSNGAQLLTANSIIGRTTNAQFNTATLTGPGTYWSNTTTLVVGETGSVNRLIIANGARLLSGNSAIGNAPGGHSNTVLLTGTDSHWQPSALTAGNANSTGNVVQVFAGATLEANTLTVLNPTAGNAITNNAGIYQFTSPTPAFSATGVAIDSGIISYRGITTANVTNPLTGLSFDGNNTFRLNAASNTTAATQTYTFDTGLGAANYTRLELINGATAYRTGHITIGAGGSFLASNTAATITGLFTNNGAADLVNSTVNFTNALHVAGTLTLRNSFLTGTGARTIPGTLRGNGAVTANTTLSGNLSPGFSVGTLVFSNDLTLTGSYAAELDGTGIGTSDQVIVVSALTLTGSTLNLSELVTADDATYVIASYGSLTGMFGTVNGLPSGYALDYNYGAANQIAVVLVPEPGPVLLVLLGVGLLLVIRHRRP